MWSHKQHPSWTPLVTSGVYTHIQKNHSTMVSLVVFEIIVQRLWCIAMLLVDRCPFNVTWPFNQITQQLESTEQYVNCHPCFIVIYVANPICYALSTLSNYYNYLKLWFPKEENRIAWCSLIIAYLLHDTHPCQMTLRCDFRCR